MVMLTRAVAGGVALSLIVAVVSPAVVVVSPTRLEPSNVTPVGRPEAVYGAVPPLRVRATLPAVPAVKSTAVGVTVRPAAGAVVAAAMASEAAV